MGLLLSILVGCVGVIELIDLLKCKDNEITLKSPACLSYHESDTTENLSFHDSICGLSHSSSLNLSKSARCKLENLHEYSLKVRSELRSRGYDDACTLSDFSCRDIFGMSRPDSRASLDFDLPHDDDDDDENDEKHSTYSINVDNKNDKSINNNYEINKISINELQDKLQSSNSSIDLTTSFDNDDSENELTNNNNKNSSSSTSPQSSTEPIHKCCIKNIKLSTTNYDGDTLVLIQDKNINKNCNKLTINNDKKIIKKSTSILRKPTRLKSRNADISKSAENIVYKNINKLTKRQRNPERRKSDISVQTNNQYHDESTNTISNDFNENISTSRQSISVEVQTNFNDYNNTLFNELLLPKTGLKKEFINKYDKFIKSRSLDDCIIDYYYDKNLENNLPGISVRNISLFDRDNELYNWNLTNKINSKSFLKISNSQTMNTKTMTKTMHENEDDSIDEEFLDAVEMVTCEPGSINDCINSSNKNDKNTRLIFSGEYTKAMNKDWHSGHFCCWQCDESLTGQRYVLRDEHPYCINCYESVFANNCEECGKIIGIDSKVNSCKDLSYKDKHWHEACFLCFKCRVSLVEKQFGSKGDKIYCGNCYDTQFASRCDGCGEIFRAGTKKMEYKTRQWHEKCFCCVVCKNAIGLKSFIPREQEIYCAGCYEDKFATRCIKCNKIITSGGVTYKNDPWHRECFTCTNCDNCLAGQRFTSRDEKPYCAECFGELFAKRCTSCTKPITGIGGTRFISFEDRHWHNDCFICAGCKSSLVGRGFITDADDIICPECAKVKLTTE